MALHDCSGLSIGQAAWLRKSQARRARRAKLRLPEELAMCRDVFDTPSPGDRLEVVWAAAMASPEAVPLYVEACRQDYIYKLDAKDEEIRVLSAKIVDQQRHIASLKEG